MVKKKMNKAIGIPTTFHVGRVKIKDMQGSVLLDCELAGDSKMSITADYASVSVVVAARDLKPNLTNLIPEKTPVTIKIEKQEFFNFFIENIESSGVDVITIKAVFRGKPTKKDINAWCGLTEEDE